MGRIRAKDLQPSAGDQRRHELWKVAFDNALEVFRIQKSGNGYMIITSDDTLEKIMEPAIKLKFTEANFEIVDPPELNAKRTLVITNIDDHILMHSDNDIKLEIERANRNIKVTQVIKIPNASSILKIKLDTTAMVRKSINSGILIFSQSFPTKFLAQDIYIHIPQCMRCYSYDHVKKECEKEDSYLICSKCSQTTHRFENCPSIFTKCITCGGDHPTLAARCKKRKEYTTTKAKEIRVQKKTSSATTYAQAIAPKPATPPANIINPAQSPSANPWVNPPEKHAATISTAIIYANMRESVSPGTFQHTFNRIMQSNGMPAVIIPDDVLDAKAMSTQFQLDLNSDDESEDMDDESVSRKRTRESDDDTRPPKINHLRTNSEQEAGPSTSKATISTAPSQKQKLTQLGFSLYVSEDFELPTALSQARIQVMLMETHELKYIYTGNHKEHLVIQKIMDNSMDLTIIPINKVNQDKFNGITQGYFKLNSGRNRQQ